MSVVELWIELQGHDWDLADLARVATTDELRIEEREDGKHYLRADSLIPLIDGDGLHEAVLELVAAVDRVARLHITDFEGIRHGSLVEVTDTGGENLRGLAPPATCTAKVGRVRVSTGQPEEPFTDPVEFARCVSVATESPDVAAALFLYETRGGSFRDLYFIIDLILGDVGSTLYEWVSQDDVRRLKHTANSKTILGTEARHGREPTQPPKNPTSPGEAREIVRQALLGWIRSRDA
jgi:hypothetical protein